MNLNYKIDYIKMKEKKLAVIAGAGPAGLTAAFELAERTDIVPIVLEKTTDIGGISKTVNYKGNRIDIGGHRFFSKSDRVMEWWMKMLPLEESAQQDNFVIQYQNKQKLVSVENLPKPEDEDDIMLVRNRLSRIYYLRKFFAYPVALSVSTLKNLGLIRSTKIFFSYVKARLFPIKEEKNLEDFMINRFGKVLYLTFFKDYTEKVWGMSCQKISAEWGAQRIKGLSISKAIQHAIQQVVKSKNKGDIAQKGVETSLIEKFLYPKYGPGQMWERVADLVEVKSGSKVRMQEEVVEVHWKDQVIQGVSIRNNVSNEIYFQECDYFFSTMPIRELIKVMNPKVPPKVQEVAAGLLYRDFLTVGLLLKKLVIKDNPKLPASRENLVKDNWIYIQEREVRVGRLQIFNNWSPYMVADPEHIWIGMEYFCNEGDDLWEMEDELLKQFAIKELASIEIIEEADVLDATVLRMEKAYPAYFGTYDQMSVIRDFIDPIENMFLIGRNGLHRYNNSDHSMLTAMVAVDQIVDGKINKSIIWDINTEQDYHEEK